jgi:hypothetical protein
VLFSKRAHHIFILHKKFFEFLCRSVQVLGASTWILYQIGIICLLLLVELYDKLFSKWADHIILLAGCLLKNSQQHVGKGASTYWNRFVHELSPLLMQKIFVSPSNNMICSFPKERIISSFSIKSFFNFEQISSTARWYLVKVHEFFQERHKYVYCCFSNNMISSFQNEQIIF